MFGSVRVRIDRAIYDRAKAAAAQAGYSSAEELIAHAIEERVRALEHGNNDEELQRRLRGLGYLG